MKCKNPHCQSGSFCAVTEPDNLRVIGLKCLSCGARYSKDDIEISKKMKELVNKVIINNLRQDELTPKEKGELVKELLKIPKMTYGRLEIILQKSKGTLHGWVNGKAETKKENKEENKEETTLDKITLDLKEYEPKQKDKLMLQNIITICKEKLETLK